MEENTINRIIDAYVMQPEVQYIGRNYGTFDNPLELANIVFKIDQNNGDKYEGFTQEGEIIFSIQAKAVNVFYGQDNG